MRKNPAENVGGTMFFAGSGGKIRSPAPVDSPEKKPTFCALCFPPTHDMVSPGTRCAGKGRRTLEIHGLQKLTLLDYPGHTACTVFTGRCNWRCPFCHNASLVLRPEGQPLIAEEEIFSLLRKRRGLLDGVAVTGGEPTLQKDLPDFLRRIRDMGFAVKLDTNGTNPAMLRSILEEGLADYVAMDIKAGRSNYPSVTGTIRPGLPAVEESASLLMEGRVDFEFRTTVVRELHSEEDFADIGPWLRGDEKYFLQAFKDSGDILTPGHSPCTRPEMEGFRQQLLPFIPRTELRGLD